MTSQKKLKFFLPLLMFLAQSAFSQMQVRGEEGKWQAGIFFSYDYNLSSGRVIIDPYSGYEASYNRTNYSTGLTLEYSLWESFSANTGIGFANRNFTGTYYCEVCDFSSPPQPRLIDLQFLEVPFTGRYHFNLGDYSFYGEAGVLNHLRLNSSTHLSGPSYMLSGKIGGGIEYRFFRRYLLQFSTEFTTNITHMFELADYKYNILGFRLGIVKQL